MLPYQAEVFWRDDLRLRFLSWCRRARKSTTMAYRALRANMERPGNLNVFVSCNLLASKEALLKEKMSWDALVKKESQVWEFFVQQARADLGDAYKLESNIDGVDIDGIMDMYQAGKVETRLWHDNTTYSRTLVIASNPMTAVGYGGSIFADEVGRINNLQEVLEAVIPFIQDNPALFCWMASTPPPDDKHYSWELTAPATDAFPVSKSGNWYKSLLGIDCHRVDVDDYYAAGLTHYSLKDGSPITAAQSREETVDKIGWDRNNKLKYLVGGSAAYDVTKIKLAQSRAPAACIAHDCTEQVVA